MRVLINASNLRVGGGVQVASSFLDELALLVEDEKVVAQFPWLRDGLTVQASDTVLENTRSGTAGALSVREHTATVDPAVRLGPRYDVSFSVFGPEYVPFRAKRRVAGFADVTSLFPEAAQFTAARNPIKRALRRHASKAFVRHVDHVVVESHHIAKQLRSRWGLSPDRIHVVPNTVHSVFNRREEWHPSPLKRASPEPHALYVTRGYAHKNLKIIASVGDEHERRGLPMRFVLTLEPAEWAALPAGTRRHCVNVGPVSVHQLGHLYEACEAAFFPSLLEAFSVTPLEALITGTPLVASNREFVRQISEGVPYLAEPDDPMALAQALIDAVTTGKGPRTQSGVELATDWPSARSRAATYLDIIRVANPPRSPRRPGSAQSREQTRR